MPFILVFLGLIQSIALAAPDVDSIPYDPATNTWQFDPVEMVSRNDTVYTTASPEPWEAMPVGGGDLSAMVRFDGESIHLHLTKSDAWGFQAPPDAPLGTRFFNNVSPGHVRIALGDQGRKLAAAGITQRMDLYRGRIVLTLGSGDEAPEIAIWGHPERDVLVVEVSDPKKALGPIDVELTEWRDTVVVTAVDGALTATEVHTRPAAPHMAASGMEAYFTPDTDPLLGRGTAVLVAAPDISPESAEDRVAQASRLCIRAEGTTASFTVPAERPERYSLFVACAVTPKAGPDPLADVQRELDAARALPLTQLREEHDAWWRAYWSKSFLRLESPDGMAQRLTQAYYVHLYTLACTNRGPVPAKWDGGPGLMRGDERTWGLAEWVQEIRFTYLPLYAANRLAMAKGLTDHYTRMRPFLEAQTTTMWGVPGLWIPETVLPWGGVEDWVLREEDGTRGGFFTPWDPATAPYGKFHYYNQYVGFLLTCGPELCWHYLTYYQYSGDEDYLANEAYPVLRGVAEFLSHLLRQGDDGRYHMDPANGLETWWMARDPADVLDGIRWLYGEFIPLSERYGKDAALRERCREQLAALPEPTIGVFRIDGSLDTTIDAYAAAGAVRDRHRNFENPALYRVFPFGLSGIGTADHDRAVRIFSERIFPLNQSWSMDAIWAARLGLKDQACAILGDHTKKWHRFRYGGWDSGNSTVFPDGLSVVPYNDGPGVAFTALQEILLQSHDGVIRVLPAIASDWSGMFQLRAEGGFLVGVAFEEGVERLIEMRSELGKECVVENPWGGRFVVRTGGEIVQESDEPLVRFATDALGVYMIEPGMDPKSRDATG